MDIITRKQAREQGLTRYFTGSLCKRGNADWRKTCDSSCLCSDCKAHNNRVRAARKQARGDEFKALRCQEEKQRRARRGGELNAVRRERYETDSGYRQAVLGRNTEWRATNREQADAIVRSWLSKNPGAKKEYHAKRRAQLRGCLPALTEQELKQIKAIYRLRTLLSRNSGVEYHVDHRIPISRGGLHHPDNLWVIPATENLRKHNKLPEELAA
jgi:hypothetical protein